MQLKKDKAVLQNFKDATQYEWLETNGLGGWGGSSIIGANTRRYHGLFVAATNPPAERTVLLSKLDETSVTVQAGGSVPTRTELGCNLYNGDIISPNGHHYLESFTKDLFPQWVYKVDDIQLKKTIAMIHGENTVVVIYEVVKAASSFTLELLPLMAARGYHSMQHEGAQMHWDADFNNSTFHNKPDGNLNVYINVPGASYQHTPRWFNNFKYSVEEYRGLDFTEDLFNHGVISVELKEGGSLGIIISTENPEGRDAHELLLREEKRKRELLIEQPGDEMVQQLVLAADQFIVKRGEALKTVIAGYHWFTDWGRDTMISLPGLTLSTGRFEDAKKIISAFAKSVSMGMLPNRFQDNNEPPEYNNVDGTLWYFIAIKKYLDATGDAAFVLNEILPVLKDIINWHYKGTRFNIHATEDGLLYSGEIGQQLTWMDARIGTWVVTPRMGKPVEIQALWYNALKIFAELLALNKQKKDAAQINESAEYAKQQFNEKYWYADAGLNPDGGESLNGYLYDNIDENGNPNIELRPNQLFAISLPFALIDDAKKAKAILKTVEEKLYTPVGLRSLPMSDVHYIHNYGGDQWHRDSAYHEGTVWSWLLGPYVDAVMKLNADSGKQQAKKIIEDFTYHLNEGCIGSVSEIFDADAPHHPRGCVAQAWGVAEVLRVIKDYDLITDNTEKKKTKKKKVAEA